jgi:hypothetical protein
VWDKVSEHQEYLEMCALCVSGDISNEQLGKLDDHLDGCLECRRAFNELRVIESIGMAALSPVLTRESIAGDIKPVTERTARRLLARIEDRIHTPRMSAQDVPLTGVRFIARKPHRVNGEAGGFSRAALFLKSRAKNALSFSRTLLPYAAALLLTAILSIYSYHVGARKVADVSTGKLTEIKTRADSLEAKIAELSRDRDYVNAKLQESGNSIGVLTEKIKLQLNEITSLEASLEGQRKELADRVQGAEAQRLASDSERLASDSERDVLNRKLAEAQASLAAMQKNLELARQLQSNDSLHATNLESHMDELAATIRDQDQTIRQQRDLLAYDRDIRDLIGARDLYVAEVTDVGRDAATKTPFGRVFFTKGKSLIFYAYDLDKQPGVQRTSVFRAWGRRGPDFEQALPLGILFVDSSSKRRWVLRFDDPKALAKIDAVFVTVEPNNTGRRPSGKPMLFAYLRVEPNHP